MSDERCSSSTLAINSWLRELVQRLFRADWMMRFRTPVNTSEHPSRRWKTSPPPARKGVPLQNSRPSTAVQQARGPPLDRFEPSPVKEKQLFPEDEIESNQAGALASQKARPKPQKPVSWFGLFSSLVLAVASLHLINLGNRNAARLGSNATGSDKRSFFVRGKDSFLRSSRRDLLSGRVQPPRVFFMGERAHHKAPSFQSASERKVKLYPVELSDVTQLYSLKSSDDTAIAGSIERRFFPRHETNPDCVPMSDWQTMSFPTCNNMHEMGLVASLHDESLRLLSSTGSWRDAWRFKAYVAPSGKDHQALDNVVVKTIKFQHTLQDRYFEFSRVDALAMERLTSNPYVMSVHGFCGVSVVTERGIDSVGHVADHLSSRKKVDLARKVAKSIAAVHEIDGKGSPVASLVHNDLTVDNVFWGRSGPLLNDFNIAVLMMKDKKTGESCPFPGHYPNPQWKSPEEQAGPTGNSIQPLTEKVDIYGLGNLLFRFATGNGPWRELASHRRAKLTDEQKEHIAKLKAQGKMPKVPERVLKRKDPYVEVLLGAMEMCYRLDPKDRPSAREVVEYLEQGKRRVEMDHVEFGRMIKHR